MVKKMFRSWIGSPVLCRRVWVFFLIVVLGCMPGFEISGHLAQKATHLGGIEGAENPDLAAFFSDYVFYNALTAARQTGQDFRLSRSTRYSLSMTVLPPSFNLFRAIGFICSFPLFYILIMHRSLISLSLGGHAPPDICRF